MPRTFGICTSGKQPQALTSWSGPQNLATSSFVGCDQYACVHCRVCMSKSCAVQSAHSCFLSYWIPHELFPTFPTKFLIKLHVVLFLFWSAMRAWTLLFTSHGWFFFSSLFRSSEGYLRWSFNPVFLQCIRHPLRICRLAWVVDHSIFMFPFSCLPVGFCCRWPRAYFNWLSYTILVRTPQSSLESFILFCFIAVVHFLEQRYYLKSLRLMIREFPYNLHLVANAQKRQTPGLFWIVHFAVYENNCVYICT